MALKPAAVAICPRVVARPKTAGLQAHNVTRRPQRDSRLQLADRPCSVRDTSVRPRTDHAFLPRIQSDTSLHTMAVCSTSGILQQVCPFVEDRGM